MEINQAILEKDRGLKLELELSNSLQTEMTNKLTMYQRIVRQLNEKVASQDELVESLRADFQDQLSKKVREHRSAACRPCLTLLRRSERTSAWRPRYTRCTSGLRVRTRNWYVHSVVSPPAQLTLSQDDMWRFISNSYQLLRSAKHGHVGGGLDSSQHQVSTRCDCVWMLNEFVL